MGSLVLQLVPVLLGIILSPLAIMALIAVLVSQHARRNGIAYLAGWIIGLAGLLLLFQWIFRAAHPPVEVSTPLWVALVRLLLALVLIGGGIWVYHKGAARIRRMAAASGPKDVAKAATLPGWLQSVSTFRPARTLVLGVGLFVLNPVDATCAILAALDLAVADVTATQQTWTTIVFIIIGVLPIAVPVVWLLISGTRAQPALDSLRAWIAGHTHVLNAALLLFIGAMQLQKAVQALLS
jgi:hypothetical protein